MSRLRFASRASFGEDRAMSIERLRALLRAIVEQPLPYSTSATEIERGLWVGPTPTLEDVPELVSMRVALVIDCTVSAASRFLDDIGLAAARMHCPMADDVERQNERCEEAMGLCIKAAAAALRKNRTVLVHCRSGVYCAPSIAYGALRWNGATMIEATSSVARRTYAIPRYIENTERIVMRFQPPSAWNP